MTNDPSQLPVDELIELFGGIDAGRFSNVSDDVGRNSMIDALLTQIRADSREEFNLDLDDPKTCEVSLRTIVAAVKLGAASTSNMPVDELLQRVASCATDGEQMLFLLQLLEGAELITRAAAQAMKAPDLSGFETIELPDDLREAFGGDA